MEGTGIGFGPDRNTIWDADLVAHADKDVIPLTSRVANSAGSLQNGQQDSHYYYRKHYFAWISCTPSRKAFELIETGECQKSAIREDQGSRFAVWDVAQWYRRKRKDNRCYFYGKYPEACKDARESPV